MFGNMEEQQRMLQEKMKAIKIDHTANDGSISLTINGNLEIENISIDLSKLDMTSSDQLEDTLIITLNEAIQRAQMSQAAESQKLLSEMLPGGFGDLGKLFG